MSRKKRRKTADPQTRQRRRQRNKITGELEERPASEEEAQAQSDEVENAAAEAMKKEIQAQVQAQVKALGPEEYVVSNSQDVRDDRSIQIVELHSQSPTISFRGNIYKCHWSTSLGTDMFFAKKPEATVEEEAPPLRSFDKWDLLGISSTRLIASEARLVPKRRKQFETETAGADDVAEEEVPQASFLRRFVQVQAKKGELATAGNSAAGLGSQNGKSTLQTESEALQALFAGGTAVTTKATGGKQGAPPTPSSSKAVANRHSPSAADNGAEAATQHDNQDQELIDDVSF
jgi:transcription initiation factor TFIIIC subunit-like protein